jgi:pyroglutamyl-peptidase
MNNKLLLTSFQTWLPHQKSNSSDDLLEIIQEQADSNLYFVRKLPVDSNLAALPIIEAIERIEPKSIICCGMAESRSQLTVESNAVCDRNCISTKVNLEKLVSCLNNTKISHDAGKFVCEGLYYQILKYIQSNQLNIKCIFVHIPLINPNRLNIIQQDFIAIINFMQSIET